MQRARKRSQFNIEVSREFRHFFRELLATEQLRFPAMRITNKSIIEKALLQYARRTHPNLIPNELVL